MKKTVLFAVALFVLGALAFSSCEDDGVNQNGNPIDSIPDNPNDTIPDDTCIATKGLEGAQNNYNSYITYEVHLAGDDCTGMTSKLSILDDNNADSIDVLLDDQFIERVYSVPWEKTYDITELSIGQHVYTLTKYSHYMGEVETRNCNHNFKVLDLSVEPCTPTKEADFSEEVVDNTTTHIDIKVKGNDCVGIWSNIFLDYSSNDFEYWEVILDDQTVRQTNQQLDFVYINNTELPLGVHTYRFDLHHGGSTTSFECSFTIAASE